MLERRTVHLRDLLGEEGVGFPVARSAHAGVGTRTILATPLLREGAPIGGIVIRRSEVRPFTDQQIALLETFADQAVIAIENAWLFEERAQRNTELTDAQDRQTATSEILRVIASSPSNLRPVLDALVKSVMRLCGASGAGIFRTDGDQHWMAATCGSVEVEPVGERRPVDRASVNGRAILERRTIHVGDLLALPPDEYPRALRYFDRHGHRTLLAAPLLTPDGAIGSVIVARREAHPFSDAQVELVQGFADQAVIAIENARLFEELEQRTADLTQSLERQTALGEVLRVIASSPTDVQTALDAILGAAARLCDATGGAILQVRDTGGRLAPRAVYGGEQAAHVRYGVRDPFAETDGEPIIPESMIGSAFLQGRTVALRDLAEAVETAYPASRLAQERLGLRSAVAVPLRGRETAIGIFGMQRDEVRPFTQQRPSSRSRTRGSSRSWSSATTTSARRWSSRPPPLMCCGSSLPHPQAWTRYSERSCRAPRASAGRTTA